MKDKAIKTEEALTDMNAAFLSLPLKIGYVNRKMKQQQMRICSRYFENMSLNNVQKQELPLSY